jgi:hypothetical protein
VGTGDRANIIPASFRPAKRRCIRKRRKLRSLVRQAQAGMVGQQARSAHRSSSAIQASQVPVQFPAKGHKVALAGVALGVRNQNKLNSKKPKTLEQCLAGCFRCAAGVVRSHDRELRHWAIGVDDAGRVFCVNRGAVVCMWLHVSGGVFVLGGYWTQCRVKLHRSAVVSLSVDRDDDGGHFFLSGSPAA